MDANSSPRKVYRKSQLFKCGHLSALRSVITVSAVVAVAAFACRPSTADNESPSFFNGQTEEHSHVYPKPDPTEFKRKTRRRGTPSSAPASYGTEYRDVRGFSFQPSGGSGGRIGSYETTTAGVEFKVWTPSRAVLDAGPTQVFMYLHGDTARDYHNDFAFDAVRDYVLSQGLIFTAVLAPDGDSWWRSDAQKVARGISGVFEYLFENYDVYENANFVQGVSGGSTGQTMYFYPKGGAKYVRASFLDCGGAAGRLLGPWEPSIQTVRNTKFFITHGDDDYLADPNGSYGDVIGDAKKLLKEKNFDVKVRVLEGEGHCTFSHLPHVQDELPDLIIEGRGAEDHEEVTEDHSEVAAADFEVGLETRPPEGRYTPFRLSLNSETQELRRVETVSYDIHETFENESYTSSNRQNNFATLWYKTYASGWRTGDVTIRFTNGEKTVIPGARIP